MEYSFYQNEEQKQSAFRNRMNEYLMATGIKTLGLLVAVIVITVSVVIWFFTASVAIGIDVYMEAKDGNIELYVLDSELDDRVLEKSLDSPGVLVINGIDCIIVDADVIPREVTWEMESYKRYLGDFQLGDWYYLIQLKGDIPDTVSQTHVIIGWETPAALLFGD